MALLAETLVEEWLNRQGYFTIRGIREGVNEIDLLAVRPGADGRVEDALHVEVTVSFNPVAYITKLTARLQKELDKGPNSAVGRNDGMLQECVASWVDKKFSDPKKAERRQSLWPGVTWGYALVHAEAKDPKELRLIEKAGVRLIRLETVLADLCRSRIFTTTAGTDLAELIGFYARKYDTAAAPVRVTAPRRTP